MSQAESESILAEAATTCRECRANVHTIVAGGYFDLARRTIAFCKSGHVPGAAEPAPRVSVALPAPPESSSVVIRIYCVNPADVHVEAKVASQTVAIVATTDSVADALLALEQALLVAVADIRRIRHLPKVR